VENVFLDVVKTIKAVKPQAYARQSYRLLGQGIRILPCKGRWQPAGLTEGSLDYGQRLRHTSSTTSRWLAVPLPVPGRIWSRDD